MAAQEDSLLSPITAAADRSESTNLLLAWFSFVCTFHEMYVAICTLNMSYTTLNIQVHTLYVHVYMIQNAYVIV
jgi:hypothetical protein